MKDIWCRKRLTRWQRFWRVFANKCDCPSGECWPMGRDGPKEPRSGRDEEDGVMTNEDRLRLTQIKARFIVQLDPADRAYWGEEDIPFLLRMIHGYAANDRAERMLAALKDEATRNKACLAVSELRAAEVGGCFNPVDDNTGGECADDDCYCLRQCQRETDVVFAIFHDLLASIATETQAQEPGR